jgi:hypothetical protein
VSLWMRPPRPQHTGVGPVSQHRDHGVWMLKVGNTLIEGEFEFEARGTCDLKIRRLHRPGDPYVDMHNRMTSSISPIGKHSNCSSGVPNRC